MKAVRRVELLRRRAYEGQPIREIAREWSIDGAVRHHEYARARQEFRAALKEVLAFQSSGSTPVGDGDLEDLLRLVAPRPSASLPATRQVEE